MNDTQSKVQIQSALELMAGSPEPVTDFHRLAVVLFDVEEEALLARRILEVVKPRNLSVVLIGVTPDPRGQSRLRRKLATLAAFLRDWSAPTILVEIHSEAGRDWLMATGSLLRPYDMLACYSGQMVGILGRPLCDVLASELNRSVYTFTGLQDLPQERQSLLSQATSWLTPLAAIAGFLLVEVRIVATTQGLIQTTLLLVALFAEVGLLWLLSSLLG